MFKQVQQGSAVQTIGEHLYVCEYLDMHYCKIYMIIFRRSARSNGSNNSGNVSFKFFTKYSILVVWQILHVQRVENVRLRHYVVTK